MAFAINSLPVPLSPGDQNGRARRRNLRHQVEQRQDFFALADDVREVVALLQRALQLNVFFAQAAAFDGQRDLRQQFVVRPRLGDVILRAVFERRRAISIEPYAVIRTMESSGSRPRISRSRSRPLRSGRLTSSSRRSNGCSSNAQAFLRRFPRGSRRSLRLQAEVPGLREFPLRRRRRGSSL